MLTVGRIAECYSSIAASRAGFIVAVADVRGVSTRVHVAHQLFYPVQRVHRITCREMPQHRILNKKPPSPLSHAWLVRPSPPAPTDTVVKNTGESCNTKIITQDALTKKVNGCRKQPANLKPHFSEYLRRCGLFWETVGEKKGANQNDMLG